MADNWFSAGVGHGSYLVAKEADDSTDSEVAIFTAEELAKFRFVDFMDSDGFEDKVQMSIA